MRGRFAGPDALVVGQAFQPKTYTEALYPERAYHYFTPTQEMRGLCPIGQHESTRKTAIPAIHVAVARREQGRTLKDWAIMTQDTDTVLSAAAAAREQSLNVMIHSIQSANGARSVTATSDPETVELIKSIGAGQSSHLQPSHSTDFIQTCIYGPGGSACSSVPSELFRDSYLFLSRRGYSTPVPIMHSGSEASKGSAASGGGTVKATFASLLNPLLDPKMSAPALTSMLPQELRVYRPPDAAAVEAEMDAADQGDEEEGADEGGQAAAHKASSSSSFLFSKSSKVFRIKAVRATRIDKPVRRGAIVTIGDRLVPTLGGGGGGRSTRQPPSTTSTRGRKKAGADGKDEDDLTLAERFGHMAPAEVDEFAIVDPKIGEKRGREGDAQPDDGGDGVDSNVDADTNSLSSFSGEDNDDDDMSGDGGSDGELFL